MNGYLVAAIAALLITLCGSGYLLKEQIESNGELKAQAVQRDETINRQASEIKAAAKERAKLDAIITQRDTERKANESKASTGKESVRVAAKQPTDFGRCAGVHVPADVMQRLRGDKAGGSANDKAIPAVVTHARVSATFYP